MFRKTNYIPSVCNRFCIKGFIPLFRLGQRVPVVAICLHHDTAIRKDEIRLPSFKQGLVHLEFQPRFLKTALKDDFNACVLTGQPLSHPGRSNLCAGFLGKLAQFPSCCQLVRLGRFMIATRPIVCVEHRLSVSLPIIEMPTSGGTKAFTTALECQEKITATCEETMTGLGASATPALIEITGLRAITLLPILAVTAVFQMKCLTAVTTNTGLRGNRIFAPRCEVTVAGTVDLRPIFNAANDRPSTSLTKFHAYILQHFRRFSEYCEMIVKRIKKETALPLFDGRS